jgi:hypothetical protein
MKTRLRLTLALILVGAFSAQSVHADDFSFTFTNNTPGDVDGTVTGDIYGLVDNANSTPTSIVMTSAPADLGITTPNTWIPSDSIFGTGYFTVTNGVITASSFGEISYLGLPNYTFDASENSVGVGSNTVQETQGSFDAATFAAVPEPSPFGLLVVGAATLIGWKRFSARSFLDGLI